MENTYLEDFKAFYSSLITNKERNKEFWTAQRLGCPYSWFSHDVTAAMLGIKSKYRRATERIIFAIFFNLPPTWSLIYVAQTKNRVSRVKTCMYDENVQ